MSDGIYGWTSQAREQYKKENPDTKHNQVEEPFNDRIIELIDRSLVYGPELLNALQPIDFDEKAEIVGHQRDPMNIGTREIDIVLKDSTKVVGYESKRGSDIILSQLEEEFQQLHRAYSDSHEIRLVLITDHVNEPDKVEEIDIAVKWMSWYDMAQRVNNFEPQYKNSAHEELRYAFKKILELENMEANFEGFDNAHPRQLDHFIREVKFHAPRTEAFRRADFIERMPKSFKESLNKNYRPLGKRFYTVELDRRDWNYIEDGWPRSYPCIVVDRGNIEAPVTVYAGVSTNSDRIEIVADLVRENRHELKELVDENDLGIIFADNTLTHSDTNHDPDICSSEEISSWTQDAWDDRINNLLDDSVKDHKRVIFYREITSPAETLVPDAIATTKEVSDLFIRKFPSVFEK